jgi:hypothetical protein
MKPQQPRAKPQLAATQTTAPWWFEDDTEICSSCQHSYAYQTGAYCLDCDANVCSLCVQESLSIELVCHGCETVRSSEKETS